MSYTNLTVGEIIDALSKHPRETEIHIEGHIFHKWKWRGDHLLAMELNTVEEVEEFRAQSKDSEEPSSNPSPPSTEPGDRQT